MQAYPEIKAVAEELKKLNRTLEMLNSNIVVAVNVMRGEQNPGATVTTNPNPAFITYQSGDPRGTAQ